MTTLVDSHHYRELAQLDSAGVVQRTGCTFDAERGCYTLPVWNRSCSVFPGNARVDWAAPALPGYFSLFAVHYLLTAQNIRPANQWISEKDMPGGTTFFRGPHAIPTHLITARTNNRLDTFQELCTVRGGTPLAMADAAFSFTITDRIPVALLYWCGDDEFPAEAKLLFDQTLPSHFALDIVFALAVGVCEELARV